MQTSHATRLVQFGTILLLAGCMSSAPDTAPDPRVGLKAGKTDAAAAIGNMRMLSNAPSPEGGFENQMNSDLAFTGNYAVQGNFHGPVIWDMTDPTRPQVVATIAESVRVGFVEIDWVSREQAFRDVVANAKKRASTGYDCLVPVSGGKDSTWQIL